MKEALLALGQRAHEHARALSFDEHVKLLNGASGHWDGIIAGTLWFQGKFDTRDGLPFSDSLETLVSVLSDYSKKVVEKGTGIWFTPATSTNGRCRDCDIESITQLGLDADEVGEWEQGIKLFESSRLAYVTQRSSSHRQGHPKFHMHLPLLEWWSGEKIAWRQIYRHCVGWFSVAAGLRSDLTIPSYGFDLKTDRKGQPWYFSAKREEEQPAPEIRWKHGSALDLEAFLAATHFELCPETHSVPQLAIRTRRRDAKVVELGTTRVQGKLEYAFVDAGWAAQLTSEGARVVLCPWRTQHSSGYDYDDSTVIFPPSNRTPWGWFHCSHAHCAHRTQRDVLRMLPPITLRHALLSNV